MVNNQSTIYSSTTTITTAVAMTRSFTLLLLLLLQSCLAYNVQQPQQSPTTPKPPKSLTTTITTRRNILTRGMAFSSLLLLQPPPQSANAFFDQNKDRRQLELCIVNILRLKYWAQTIVITLEKPSDQVSLDERKRAYLDARLGGKAVVADKSVKIGGGASLKVFTLKGLELKECLKDLKYYASARKLNNKQMDKLNDDLIEALASLVEFDGLETTQDPSPRSSLTLSMYNADKELFVKRMLSERVIGIIDDIVNIFGPDVREQCEQYAADFYPSELPPKRITTIITPTTTIEAQEGETTSS